MYSEVSGQCSCAISGGLELCIYQWPGLIISYVYVINDRLDRTLHNTKVSEGKKIQGMWILARKLLSKQTNEDKVVAVYL